MTPKEEYPYYNSNIVCECGHPIWSHNYISSVGLCCAQCQCKLSDDAVEARYWARKMYSRLFTSLCRNQWSLQRNIELEKQRDEALKHMHSNFEEWYKALAERDEAREELKKLTSRWNDMVAEWHDKHNAMQDKFNRVKDRINLLSSQTPMYGEACSINWEYVARQMKYIADELLKELEEK